MPQMTGLRRGLARLSALAVAMLLLSPSPTVALDLSEWVQGLRVSPFVSERFEYETNVFQVPSHSQGDLIFKTIPGVLVEYGTGPNWVSAGYRAEILRFLELTSQDAVHHIFLGQAHFQTNRLSFNLRDSFINTTDPATSELTGRIESTTNTFLPDVDYRLTSRFAIGANAVWTYVRFPDIPELDRNEFLVGGSVVWKVQPRTELRLIYNYGEKLFSTDEVRDVSRHLVLLSLKGDLTAKLSSNLRVGYEDRQPKNDTPGVVPYRGLVFGGDLVYRPTDRLTISLLTDRSVQESIFANQLYFVSTIGTLVVEQRFTPKLWASVRVTGGQNDYPTKAAVTTSLWKFRKDTLVGWGASVGYDLQKWLRLGLDYLHITRDSNFPEFSFKDDKIAGTITLQF